MVNTELLFEVINDSDFTIPELAKELKIDSSTLYRKIKKPESFKIKEELKSMIREKGDDYKWHEAGKSKFIPFNK